MILLTDGVNNRGSIDPRTAAPRGGGRSAIKIYTIGVGTEGMAPVPVGRGLFGLRYEERPVEIDETLLTDVANITGGRYFRARDAAALRRIYQQIDQLERVPVQTKTYVRYTELYRWPLGLALLSLLFELGLSAGRRRCHDDRLSLAARARPRAARRDRGGAGPRRPAPARSAGAIRRSGRRVAPHARGVGPGDGLADDAAGRRVRARGHRAGGAALGRRTGRQPDARIRHGAGARRVALHARHRREARPPRAHEGGGAPTARAVGRRSDRTHRLRRPELRALAAHRGRERPRPLPRQSRSVHRRPGREFAVVAPSGRAPTCCR